MVNMYSFAGYVSVATSQLCHSLQVRSIHRECVNKWIWLSSHKTLFTKQADQTTGTYLPTLALGYQTDQRNPLLKTHQQTVSQYYQDKYQNITHGFLKICCLPTSLITYLYLFYTFLIALFQYTFAVLQMYAVSSCYRTFVFAFSST